MKDEYTQTNIFHWNWTYFTLVAAELSPHRTGFNLMAVHVRFIVGEVARRNIFPRFHNWSVFIRWRITDATEGVEHKVRRTSRWYYAIHFGHKMLHQHISNCQALYLSIRILVFQNCARYCTIVPVPVAARSKAWDCGLSPAEIVGSNPTGGMDVCLLWVLCVVR